MTDEEIHNIYLHMSGKAEGIAEVTGTADFPVLFARAILEFNRMDRKWIGLTEEDLFELAPIWFEGETSLIDFVALVDAKLKEKNT